MYIPTHSPTHPLTYLPTHLPTYILTYIPTHDPANGVGLVDEIDWGNFSGSILMLAMLDGCYLPKGTRPLSIFGANLLEKGTALRRSGRGPDNRRTNALEALLNHLQPLPQATKLRQMLRDTWRLLHLGVACSGVTNPFPSECVHQLLACKDEHLPSGAITDEEVVKFVTVKYTLEPEVQKRLHELPEREATKADIVSLTGCKSNSSTVSLIHQAIHQCAFEGAGAHCGNLLFLFFASTRRACKPKKVVGRESD